MRIIKISEKNLLVYYERITGVYIAETVMGHLKKLRLELNNIHDQGYNEVFNMSSINVGVQGIIKK